MVNTVPKTVLAKLISKRMIYKNLDSGKLKRELETIIYENSNVIRKYDFFEKVCLLVLSKYVPVKTKILRLLMFHT